MKPRNNEIKKYCVVPKFLVTDAQQVLNKQNNKHTTIMVKIIGFELHKKQKKAEVTEKEEKTL